MHGLIRRQLATCAARHDGARLREGLIQRARTARDVWADSAHRSVENEAWLTDQGMVSRIHRKKPRGRPMPQPTRRCPRPPLGDPLADRARLRPAEGAHEDDHPHRWDRPSAGGDHARKHGLQYDPLAVAQRPGRVHLIAVGATAAHPPPIASPHPATALGGGHTGSSAPRLRPRARRRQGSRRCSHVLAHSMPRVGASTASVHSVLRTLLASSRPATTLC